MSNATISAADQVATAFDFTVDKFPLSGPDGMRTPWYAMFRSDSGEVVGEGSVTDRYTPHQTEDVVALVDACESVFDEASQVKTHFRNGHYVSIAPSDDYRRSIYGSNDNIFPASLSVAVMIALRSTSLWAFFAMLAAISQCFAVFPRLTSQFAILAGCVSRWMN